MANFKNYKQVEKWLGEQPKDVVSVFAARSALRASTNLVYLINNSELNQSPENIVLQCFWSISTALSYACWPSKSIDLNRIAAVAADNVDTNATALADSLAKTAAQDYYSYANIFDEYSFDRNLIAAGGTATQLVERRLWKKVYAFDELLPVDLVDKWDELKEYLLNLKGQDWGVWITWYEDRLRGIPLIEEMEIGDLDNNIYGRSTLPKYYYSHPKFVNAKIRELLHDYLARYEPPQQKIATVCPIIKDGKIYLSDTKLDSDLEFNLAKDNLQSLKEEFIEFCESIPSKDNFDTRPVSFIKTIILLISDDLPDSKTLFRLIRKEAVLLKHEEFVKQQWPQFLADHYSTLCTEFGQVLDQFPDRRVFQRQKLEVEIESVGFSEFEEKFQSVTDAMREEISVIDSSVADEIKAISDPLDGIEIDVNEHAIIIADKLESTNNVLKVLCDTGLDKEAREQALKNIANSYGIGLMSGVLTGANEAGVEDGKLIGKTIGRSEATRAIGEKLYERYPKTFGWMKRFLRSK